MKTVTEMIGDVVDRRFRLSSVIGHGPHGVVYAAQDEAGAELAVKIVHAARRASDAALEVFRVQALRRHAIDSRFAAVTAVGRLTDGTPYVVSPRESGESWAGLVDRRGWLVLEDVLACLEAAAPALDRARDHGLVHGDIHPGNIIGVGDGIALVDAGLGSLVEGCAFCPERHDDTRALAATAFELLTGVPPYRRSIPFDRRHVRTIQEATGLPFDEEIEKALARAMLAPPFAPGYERSTDLVRALRAASEDAVHRPVRRRVRPDAMTARPRRRTTQETVT